MTDHPVVLVVEDDVEMNQLQRELLALHGLDAVAAYTGAEAIEVWAKTKTDAVLLDVMLPEMDGFETCRKLRRTSRVPVVMLTALDGDESRRRGFEAGADVYFVKPFDPDDVVDALWRLIRGPSTQPKQH